MLAEDGVDALVGDVDTSADVVPIDDGVAILLTQLERTGPTGSQVVEGFWSAAAGHLSQNMVRPTRSAPVPSHSAERAFNTSDRLVRVRMLA